MRQNTGARIVLSEELKGFLIARNADGLSKYTLASYKHDVGLLAKYLDDPPINKINTDDLRRFMAWLRDEYVPTRKNGDKSPLSNHTLANIMVSLKAFFNWVSKEYKIKRPDADMRIPDYTDPEIIPFTQEEVQALLKAAEWSRDAVTNGRKSFRMKRPTARRDLAIILVLLDTGLRVSEIAFMKLGDVNLDDGSMMVRSRGSGKKSRNRIVYLGKVARTTVWRYLTTRQDQDEDAPLFTTVNDRMMDRDCIRLALNRMAEVTHVQDCHPHRFRHTFAVEYLRNGGDIFTLQRILGHNSLDMVSRYLHLVKADIEAAHRRVSPADKWRL
jgi:integrase/recombinase XerD